MGYQCETKPRRVQLFIERTRDGQVLPVQDVEILDVACGVNHVVSKPPFSQDRQIILSDFIRLHQYNNI